MVGVLVTMLLLCATAAGPAAEPVWVEPAEGQGNARQAVFTGTVVVNEPFDRALVRLAAYDRYRLFVNRSGVSVGDTPWEAETFDVAPMLRKGVNEVRVEVAADAAPMPENSWIVLERRLAKPGSFERIRFHTGDARHNEWIYLELIDADGNSSGYYCAEKGGRDLVLGTSGERQQHVIELARQPRLLLQAGPECDFSRVAAVRLRVDQKHTSRAASGAVRFTEIALEGKRTVDWKDMAGWRVTPGRGEHRRSRVESIEQGFVLHYDFTPRAPIRLALDLRVWFRGNEIASLSSGPDLLADGKPAVRVATKPMDTWMWTSVALAGAGDAPQPPTSARATLRFEDDVDRWPTKTPLRALVHVLSLGTNAVERVYVEAENWQGKPVFSQATDVTCREGEASVAVPGLPRGIYRFRARVGRQDAPGTRYTALAVLGPGEERMSDLFDTLSAAASQAGLQGIDLSYNDSPALLLAIRDLGVNFLQVHISPRQLDDGEFDELLGFCRATGLRFALNNESSNWSADGGNGRFDAAGGCHRWDLDPAALGKAAATGLFEGVVYDEGEHMQLCRNYYAKLPEKEHRRPYLVETTGMNLEEAYDAFLAAARTVRRHNGTHGSATGSHGRMLVESVFPALWHPLARAEVTLCPKLLKESIHPVVLALALGAVKQYETELWLTPDLWYRGRGFPGHTVEDYAAALRLAHNVGVDNIYSEYIHAFCRIQGPVYDLTPYAAALREFMTEWRPTHPRDYTYRDYEPEVAIIRFPDSDWGQASSYYWNMLYGAENLQSTPETRQWLQVWHLLTGGRTHADAVNANSGEAYPLGSWYFSYPCAPTAVYDHLVGAEPLAGVKTIFLCGITLSEGSLKAVRERVRDGATCFTTPRLCPPDVRQAASVLPASLPDGKGTWIVVSGFRREDLGATAEMLPEPGSAMRLQFRGQMVSVESKRCSKENQEKK
ncbi:MAG: hypothetical protein GXY83_31445 [Rhodopirellula sp.]|nr:hypothetical protein [Rhodopirellula sp.]